MSKPRIYDSLLLRLPVEVSLAVVSYLSNRDIKSLRLTCTRLSQIAHLRLSRVFLSANTLNIQVFRAVADHERYRHNVAEIIWDDVQLPEDLDRTIITDNYNPPCYEYFREDDLALYDLPQPPEGIPILFYQQCVWNIKNRGQVIQRYCKEADIERDHELPLDVSWNYYQHLVQQQKAVKSSGCRSFKVRTRTLSSTP